MKRVTASDARRNWFRILDRVAAGEVVVIERHGRRIILRREEGEAAAVPDYEALIRPLADVDRADEWSWTWDEEVGLAPTGESEE